MNLLKSTLGLFLMSLAISCTPKVQTPLTYKGEFPNATILQNLIEGNTSYNEETTMLMLRKYQFQKRAKLKNAYGIIIPKSMVQIAINGFSEDGPNDPTSRQNFDKWDFIICYPGLSINSLNDESLKPAIFFYKGKKDENGILRPSGDPVEDIEFPRGGGGPGEGGLLTPPPNK